MSLAIDSFSQADMAFQHLCNYLLAYTLHYELRELQTSHALSLHPSAGVCSCLSVGLKVPLWACRPPSNSTQPSMRAPWLMPTMCWISCTAAVCPLPPAAHDVHAHTRLPTLSVNVHAWSGFPCACNSARLPAPIHLLDRSIQASILMCAKPVSTLTSASLSGPV